MRRVSFIDTSVMCELVEVPGKCRGDEAIANELRTRSTDGERFIVPLTTVVETGNHIAQAKTGNRRAAATRFAALLEAAAAGRTPFEANQVTWDPDFLAALLGGDSTGQSFVDLAGNGQMGGGDVAILVERDRYLATSALDRDRVGIWTLEAVLGAYD
jgi:hypothetical protein